MTQDGVNVRAGDQLTTKQRTALAGLDRPTDEQHALRQGRTDDANALRLVDRYSDRIRRVADMGAW